MTTTTNNGIIKARPSAYNMVDPKAIKRREGWNPRFDFGDIEQLAKSIKAQKEKDGVGVLVALRLKRLADGTLEIIDGDRRQTAVEYLIAKGEEFAEGIPAFIEGKNSSDTDNLIKMFESNNSKLFLPLEEAAAYKRFKDAGFTLAQITAVVGKKHVHIVDTLRLLEADESVKEAVRSKKIGATTAKHIAKAGKDKQAALVEKAKASPKGSGKKLKKEIEAQRVNRRAGTKVKVEPMDQDELKDLEKELSLAFVVACSDQGTMPAAVSINVQKSDELTLAVKYGILLGLRAALGHKVKVKG